MKRLGFLVFFLAASGAAWLLWQKRSGEAPENAMNCLLITLDTLRQDRLSCYGYERETSPFLDSLAARGYLFEHAYASSNITKPSHASILTGLYPKHHGVIDNTGKLDDPSILTLQRIFQSEGYHTFAAVSTSLLNRERSGFNRGFDAYYNAGSSKQRAETTVAKVLQHLGKKKKRRPFFGWVHFFDTHTRYKPPQEFLNMFQTEGGKDGESEGKLPIKPFGGSSMVKDSIPNTVTVAGRRDPNYYLAAYDGEIRYLDEQLRQLFQGLERMGLAENTMVAITSDHGEMLGEHGIYFNHCSLYREVIEVPMILVLPGMPGGRVRDVVENLDIGPTLCEFLDFEIPENLDGSGLRALMEGGAGPEPFAYAQHAYDLTISMRDEKESLILPLPLQEDLLRSPFNQYDRAAYLAYIDAEKPLYFQLQSDPAENQNRFAAEDEAIQARVKKLANWYTHRIHHPQHGQRELSQEEIELLKSLGYL